MADISEVVDKLLERTNQNKIGWRTTVTENTFIAVVGSLGVSIRLPHPAAVDAIVQFRVLDKTGQVVQELNADPIGNGAIYYKLREVHLKAKQTALADESRLDELLAELEKV